MTDQSSSKPYQQVSGVLSSGKTPLDKMRHLMALGYDEGEASLLVEQYEAGNRQAIYYEQLPMADYEPHDEPAW